MAEKAIVGHTNTMYYALRDRATQEGEHLIFRGKVTKVFGETGISNGYYSEVFRQLEGQGCILYLQRGSKSTESVIALQHPPEAAETLPAAPSPLTDAERYANVWEDVRALKTLVGGLNIVEALKTIEDRLEELERRLGVNAKPS